MNLETKITIYKFTPQVFTLTQNPRFFHSLLPKPNPFFPTQKQHFPYSFLLKSSIINVAVPQ